jgi:hypothetical protein
MPSHLYLSLGYHQVLLKLLLSLLKLSSNIHAPHGLYTTVKHRSVIYLSTVSCLLCEHYIIHLAMATSLSLSLPNLPISHCVLVTLTTAILDMSSPGLDHCPYTTFSTSQPLLHLG